MARSAEAHFWIRPCWAMRICWWCKFSDCGVHSSNASLRSYVRRNTWKLNLECIFNSPSPLYKHHHIHYSRSFQLELSRMKSVPYSWSITGMILNPFQYQIVLFLSIISQLAFGTGKLWWHDSHKVETWISYFVYLGENFLLMNRLLKTKVTITYPHKPKKKIVASTWPAVQEILLVWQ